MKTTTTFIITCLATGLSMITHQSTAGSWQQERLLQPSAAQRDAEHAGRVVIYDRVDEALVDRALDNQFERIENMMFVRVQHIQADGTVTESGDCD